jgi:hypothetical protein
MIVPLPRGTMTFAASRPARKPAKRRHLPHLAIDAGRRVADREVHVRADVEDDDFQRCDFSFDLFEQGDDFFLDARIRAEAVRLAAIGADFCEQRIEAGDFAAGADRGVAFAGEAPGNRPARGVAGADDEG